MSCISEFRGIRISMYFNEHGPPHFHARYQGMDMSVAIDSGEVLAGHVPPAIRRLVREWWRRYKIPLGANWERMAARLPPLPIPPLE